MKYERYRSIHILGEGEGVSPLWYCDGPDGGAIHGDLKEVIKLDIGDGFGLMYNCLNCLDRRLEAFMEKLNERAVEQPDQPTKSTALVDGDTVTIEGVEFTF